MDQLASIHRLTWCHMNSYRLKQRIAVRKYCCCHHIRKGKCGIKRVDTGQDTTILNKIQGALGNDDGNDGGRKR